MSPRHPALELRHSDIRKVFHLVGEMAELGADPNRWRLHMLQRLIPLTGARMGIACEHFISPEDPNRTFLVSLAEWGWQKREQKLFHDHLNAGGMTQDPLHEPVQRLAFRSFTRRRRDFVSDQTWYAAPITELRRRCNVDDSLHSRRQLPHPGWSHAVTLMRAWGAPPFTVRHRFTVDLLHRELGRLWSLANCGPLVALPPRLKQTLDLIFRGYSEKQIASALNVSVHTAHDFAKRLYRHMGVAGRGDLLIHPACRRLFFCPTLSPAYYTEHGAQAAGQFPKANAPQ